MAKSENYEVALQWYCTLLESLGQCLVTDLCYFDLQHYGTWGPVDSL
jgi:hypothetical protein